MAEVIKLLIDNPKIKRTTKAKADTSEKVLEKGELLGIRNTDGTFTLKLGDGITKVKDLKELAGGGGGSDKQDILVNTLDIEAENIELDSQKFSFIKTDTATTRNITFKNAIEGKETTPEYDAEIEFKVSVLNTLNFESGTLIRTNDPDLIIENNIVKITPNETKKVQLRAQNGVVDLTNAALEGTINGIEDFLQDLITTSITGSTSIELLSKNYTKIAPTITGEVNITLETATDKTKIFRGTIKFSDASLSSVRKVNFPTGTSISTNDADIHINNNIAEITKTDEYYFTVYDGRCELVNITLTSAIPTKISQLTNDAGFINKNETLKKKTTGNDLYVDGYAEIEATDDTTLNLTNKFISGADIPSDKVPEYSAKIKLYKDKKIILPSSVTNIKVSDDESLEVGSNYILAKGDDRTKSVELELSIQGENCFTYVWKVDRILWYQMPNWYELTSEAVESEVGVEAPVTVNNQVHKVRLIGIDHDDLVSGGKAHTTWEFVNLLSDSDGYSIATFWNRGTSSGEKNFDYLNSSIYKCMEGAGNGGQEASYQGIKWYKKGEEVTTTDSAIADKTVIDMLSNELKSVLKQVKKEIGISTDSGSTKPYPKQTYNCKLFNLSYREMTATGTSTYQSEEGTAYKYYTDHDTNADRVKQQVKGTDGAVTTGTTVTDSGYSSAKNWAGYNSSTAGQGGRYWLRSPNARNSSNAYDVSNSGYIDYSNVYSYADGIAPAFCI